MARPMSSEMKEGMWVGVLLAVLLPILIFLFTVPGILLEAFVVTKLWNWFVMFQFHTIKMHYALAVGLTTLVGFMSRQFVGSINDGEGKAKIWANLAYIFVAPLIVLLIGYVAHQYV